jgi:hypothetical protein
MITGKLTHKGKEYQINEPTIEAWSSVMKLKDILTEDEMYIRLISNSTGLSRDQVLECDASTITKVGDMIYQVINQSSKQVYQEIEHQGVKYKLVNINKISFGQFVDIDTYLRKDENYRLANLNELAAYLYCETDIEYKDSDFKTRIEAMKTLPVKHVEGALFFLLSLAKASDELTKFYSQTKVMWWLMKTRITFMLIGAGMKEYLHSHKTKFGKLMRWLVSPLLLLSIIFRIFWTWLKKKRG